MKSNVNFNQYTSKPRERENQTECEMKDFNARAVEINEQNTLKFPTKQKWIPCKENDSIKMLPFQMKAKQVDVVW